jgi:hypothetical protein
MIEACGDTARYLKPYQVVSAWRGWGPGLGTPVAVGCGLRRRQQSAAGTQAAPCTSDSSTLYRLAARSSPVKHPAHAHCALLLLPRLASTSSCCSTAPRSAVPSWLMRWGWARRHSSSHTWVGGRARIGWRAAVVVGGPDCFGSHVVCAGAAQRCRAGEVFGAAPLHQRVHRTTLTPGTCPLPAASRLHPQNRKRPWAPPGRSACIPP